MELTKWITDVFSFANENRVIYIYKGWSSCKEAVIYDTMFSS